METYSIMIGSSVSAPMAPAAFKAKIRGGEIRANTQVHMRSKAAWFNAKDVPLYIETIRTIKAEKASQKATKARQAASVRAARKQANKSKPNKTKARGSRLNRPFSIENWLLDTARQWIIVVYFLVTAMFMLTIGAGLVSIFFVPNSIMIGLLGALATLVVWVMFTIGYALFAAPVIALIRIEKNTRN